MVVKVLLKAKVKKEVCNNDGQTALHLAIQNVDSDMLDVLREGGFDINLQVRLIHLNLFAILFIP